MKNIVASLLTAAALCVPAAHAQKTGDTVTPEVLGKLEWIKGEAPKEWEPGKLYILECWATWCGPCVANIPHVDALYDKYYDKGLRVIGVDVWEDGKDKVADFVKNKGDGMSYPIAYTGKGGAFETEWLKPAEVQGIPHAFVVKDGKVLVTVHPAQLTDEVVEKMLSGGDGAKAAIDDIAAKQQKQANIGKAIQAFTIAAKEKNTNGMAAAVADLKTAQPENPYLPIFESEVLISRGDWAGVEKAIDSSSDEKTRPMLIGNMSRSVARQENVPLPTVTKVIQAYESVLATAKKGPADAVVLSRLYWLAGNKDKSVEAAKSSLEIMNARSSEAPGLSSAPFEKFSTAVQGGTMPTDDEFNGWVREAMIARGSAAIKAASATTPAQPVTPKTKE